MTLAQDFPHVHWIIADVIQNLQDVYSLMIHTDDDTPAREALIARLDSLETAISKAKFRLEQLY